MTRSILALACGSVGFSSDARRKLFKSRGEVTLVFERVAEVVVRADIIRINPQRGAVLGDCAILVAFGIERVAEVPMRDGVIGIDLQRGAVFGDCAIIVTFEAERVAEVYRTLLAV